MPQPDRSDDRPQRSGPVSDGSASRARAARILAEVLADGATLPEALGRHGGEDEAFVRELCWGTARLAPRLEHFVRKHLKRAPRAKDMDVHALLLIGAYQLGWMNVPAHASVHATVEATGRLGKNWAKGLVNAVLRRLSETDLHADDGLPDVARHAHPEWLLGALRRAWPDDWLAIVEAGNARPPLTLRARGDRDEALAHLADAGIEAHAGRWAPAAIYLREARDVREVPGFVEGDFSVQDEGAQLAAVLLDAAAGERVLDACSAPGGKALHILQQTPTVELTAVDIDARRCERIRENLGRGGVEATVVEGDASTPAAWWDGRLFDRILVDAPCTATGILRRQPDVRLLREEGDVAKLATVQGELMDALWPLLKAGGTLVYCTCSVLPEEGEMIIEAFAAAHPDAVVSPIGADWGVARGAGRQLLPTAGEHDGFFYARLTRAAQDA
ncbi:MAG TPA: 16S rRNA (cytosine(967)-C(5))-methyltransferase RsmB [Pseudomonadales bacterium]|nr:16S rRNA (cytosine(967)-C(5))-methyltransferase RsmB [Pseudomonadales bacterium]